MQSDDVVEAVARIIADALGDDYADAFKNKERWIAKRGMSGGRFRDVNEPYQSDYLDAARAAITAHDTALKKQVERARKIYSNSYDQVGQFAIELDRVNRIARELLRTNCVVEKGHALLKQLMLPDPGPTPETHEAWHLAGQASPIEFQRRLDAAGLTVVRKEGENAQS